MITDTDKQHMTVGLKQTLRAIENGNVNKVFLAEDCDSSIRVSVETAASNANASMFYVKTMRELGRMCGIEVGASCAVIENY